MEMLSDTPAVAPTKPTRTYIPRAAYDRRTRAAKRFALLIAEFTTQLGGKDAISEARMATVRQLAGVILQLEEIQTHIVRGEIVDAEQHVRLANLQARLTRQLGLDEAGKAPAKQRTLADHLAEHGKAA